MRLLAGAFNAMASDLERHEKDRSEVLAGISHDLRTPLTRLRLEAEMSVADEARGKPSSPTSSRWKPSFPSSWITRAPITAKNRLQPTSAPCSPASSSANGSAGRRSASPPPSCPNFGYVPVP